MRCVGASILKSTWSLKPTGVVKITSSARSSLRTTFASGKVFSVACSIAMACAGVPVYRSGNRLPVPSELAQLLESVQARCEEMLSEASLAWGFGASEAHPLSRIASVIMPNLVFFRTIRKAFPKSEVGENGTA